MRALAFIILILASPASFADLFSSIFGYDDFSECYKEELSDCGGTSDCASAARFYCEREFTEISVLSEGTDYEVTMTNRVLRVKKKSGWPFTVFKFTSCKGRSKIKDRKNRASQVNAGSTFSLSDAWEEHGYCVVTYAEGRKWKN